MALFDQLQSLGTTVSARVINMVGRTVQLRRRTGTRNADNSTTWAYSTVSSPKAHMQPVTEQRRNAVYGAASQVESEAMMAYAVLPQSGDGIVFGTTKLIVAKVIADDLAGTATCGLRQPTAQEAETL